MNDKIKIEMDHDYTSVSRMLTNLCSAIDFQDQHPEYHRSVMARTRREWPTLMNAVELIMRMSDKRTVVLDFQEDPEANIRYRHAAKIPEHAITTFLPQSMTIVYTWYELKEQFRD